MAENDLFQLEHMACAFIGSEYVDSHIHQVVAAVLFAVTFGLRWLAWLEVNLGNGVFACWVETL